MFGPNEDCKLAVGCFDFSPLTPCPSNSLLTITASVRGEEAFIDADGDGVFDFDDLNASGSHDPGEPSEDFIDLPETFLDKNDNCFFDQFNESVRMSTLEELQHSDIFSDEDDSGDFGYELPGVPGRALANGKWDQDKELFLQARLLGLTNAVQVPVGERCTTGAPHTCSNTGATATCYERSVDGAGDVYGLAPGCLPNRLVHPDLKAAWLAGADPEYDANDVDVMTIDFTFIDGNGNCHNAGFAQSFSVNTDGPLELSGATGGDMLPLCNGLSTTGNGYKNGARPWCDDMLGLGASPTTLVAAVNCDGATQEKTPTVIELDHTQYVGAEGSVSVDVYCPVCGDGYVLGEEACDPAPPASSPNCTATCELAQ